MVPVMRQPLNFFRSPFSPCLFHAQKKKTPFFYFSTNRWNAARALARFLQRNPELYAGRTVLELGAGGGLPGLVAAKCGARKVRMYAFKTD